MPAQKNGIRRLSAVGFGGRAGFLQDLVPDENAQRVGAGIAIDLQTDDDIRIAKKTPRDPLSRSAAHRSQEFHRAAALPRGFPRPDRWRSTDRNHSFVIRDPGARIYFEKSNLHSIWDASDCRRNIGIRKIQRSQEDRCAMKALREALRNRALQRSVSKCIAAERPGVLRVPA